jgi:hypothetical protein
MREEAPELLVNNIETWFSKYPAVRMLRTLDGRGRAWLSDKFNALDNYDFANAILPVLKKRKLEIMSCEITEKRLYIKAVDEQLFKDVPVGYKMGDGSHRIFDTCAPAIICANSEVGYGRLVIESGVYTRGCTNMALFANSGMKRTHVGARHRLLEEVEDLEEIMSEQTKAKTNEALWLQVKDILASAFDQKVVEKRIEKMEAAAGNKMPGKVEKVLEVTAQKLALTDDERGDVLKYLIEGGQLSQYGLHSALTRAAQDRDDYDRATELEYMGGKVVELSQPEWASFVKA